MIKKQHRAHFDHFNNRYPKEIQYLSNKNEVIRLLGYYSVLYYQELNKSSNLITLFLQNFSKTYLLFLEDGD